MAEVIICDELYARIIDYQNLEDSYHQVTEGDKKFKPAAIEFGLMLELNLVILWRELKTGKYRVGKYTYHVVYEPKKRGIWAPSFRDKIVQTAIHNILKEVYAKVFIKHSYACLEGKGPQRATQKLQKNMRIAEREFEDPWIVSVDVSKFFYTIDHEVTKWLYRKIITCRKTLWLVDLFIDSSPPPDWEMLAGLNVNPRGSMKIGIPLGCTTSQDSANMNLNEMDQYVMRFLGHRYYVRYMDDMNIVVDGKEGAQLLMKQMRSFLREHLNLVENPQKSQIFPLEQGVNAYGFKIWTTHMKIRDDSKKRMKRKIKKMDEKMCDGEMSMGEVQQAVNSWLGHARHSNSYNLSSKIFKPYPYIKVEGDEQFGERRLN